ncbi:MAG: PBP1A family penicillin-binding protein [Azospirillaceae bacterium]
MLAIWGLIAVSAAVAVIATTLPDIAAVGAPERRPAISIDAADGSALNRYGDLTGDYVTVDELPDHLIDAVLAIEDRRFYGHPGVDPIGITRALIANIAAGRAVQGGSTITQQLAKNLFLTPERSYWRKAQEAVLALWLELNYTKDEILTAYLNRVYLGSGAYGVDAAARTYFGVSARDVTLRQAAMLAGLLAAPSRLAPTNDLDAANQRADVVLAAMVDAGFLTEAEIILAGADQPITDTARPRAGEARYFTDWVMGDLPDYVGYASADLAVDTTLDPALQAIVERTVEHWLGTEGAARGAAQAAVVVMAPDGAVLAMQGGRSYQESQFNRATQALRQPGSAFKPFVYLAGLAAGLTPSSPILDAPIERGGWSPENYSDGYQGEITLTQALATSANTAAVRVLEHAGVDAAIRIAARLGITSPLNRDLSLALGTSEVTLLELTGAYAAFANEGRPVIPYGIRVVRLRDGTTAFERRPGGLPAAVPAQAVAQLNTMLATVMTEGTGRNAAVGWTAAGKSGTSQDFRDAWFIGFTGDLVVGVWVGNDDGRPMDRVTGGGLPARIWHDIVAGAATVRPPVPLDLTPAPVLPVAMPRTVEEQRALDDLITRMIGGG